MIDVCSIIKDELNISQTLNSILKIAKSLFVLFIGTDERVLYLLRKWSEFTEIPIYILEKRYDNYRGDVARNDLLEFMRGYVGEGELCLSVDFNFYFRYDCLGDILREISKIDRNIFKYKKMWYYDEFSSLPLEGFGYIFKMNKELKWLGPIEEYLVCGEKENGLQSYILSGMNSVQYPFNFMNSKFRSLYDDQEIIEEELDNVDEGVVEYCEEYVNMLINLAEKVAEMVCQLDK